MKAKKIYLVLNNVDKQAKPDASNAAGVFFNKQNAQWFAKQLIQENRILNNVRIYTIK